MSNTDATHHNLVLPSDVTIRSATRDDRAELERLAQLDSTRLPDGPMLIAEADREPQVAYSLLERRAIANPFKRTAELIELLALHAGQVDGKRGNLRHGGRRSTAPQPPGFGAGFVPRRLGRRTV